MTRNQKIALGCGGAGCLGLIVVGIVGVVVYAFVLRPAAYRAASRTYNLNYNRNSNFNFNSNANDNSSDANTNSTPDVDANSNASASTSDLSDDDKHKLFQAALMTGDSAIINRVNIKLGLFKDNYTPTDDYAQFARDHSAWVFSHLDFTRSIGTPDKARAYVDEHLPN